MASALPHFIRSERTGSAFSRIIGLIRSGNLKWEDRPFWFDAYAAHPPHEDPAWDIKMPKRAEPLPQIFYPEDVQRAKEILTNRDEEPKYDLDEPLNLKTGNKDNVQR